MGGQPRVVTTRWSAAAAGMLLICSLAGCSGSEVVPTARVEQVSTSPAAAASTSRTVTPPRKAPDWLPAALPLPPGASITGVRVGACTVDFLLPARDADVEASTLVDRAREEGLTATLLSSVDTPQPLPEQPTDLWGEEPPLEELVMTRSVVLRMQGAYGDGAARTFDATLTLVGRGDGVVTGSYALDRADCAD